MKIKNDYLTQLKENSLILSIYQIDLSIHNLPTDNFKFNVICKKDYKIPVNLKKDINSDIAYYDNCIFYFFNIEDWFDRFTNNDLTVIECLFLNKKYIYKEYIKLTLILTPCKLQVSFENAIKNIFLKINKELSKDNLIFYLFNFIKYIEYMRQLISNGKIYNYKSLNSNYLKLINYSGEDLIDYTLKLTFEDYNFIKKWSNDLKIKNLINQSK